VDRAELRRRIAQRPNSVRFEELRRLLELYGWQVERVRGSHHYFVNGRWRFSLPRQLPQMKPTYVRQVLALIEEVPDDNGRA